MRHAPIPWFGLAALVAMFALPFVPDWVFQGPRTIRHWPRRHICGDCGARWEAGHTCGAEPSLAASLLLRGEFQRPAPRRGRQLVPRLDEIDAD